MSRKIEDLIFEMQTKYNKFASMMEELGIDFIVTCTYRPQEEQDRLYAQGRTTPGIIVTWTHNSRHTKRDAFDIAIVKNGKLSWNPKDYEVPGKLAEQCGLTWGGKWSNPDYPHFQNSST